MITQNTNNMYALKNKVQLFGNIGNAAEIKNFDGGKKLATFSIATTEIRKNEKGEKITETQWHRLIAWGKIAELVEKFTIKGTEIMIEGKLINRSYVNKEGEKKYITEVEVKELLVIGTNQKSA